MLTFLHFLTKSVGLDTPTLIPIELFNELHTQLHIENLAAIEKAFLASDGTINFIIKK